MDCDALEFHSRMAGWNAVSMATEYKTVVSDPAALKTREGTGVDEALRGFMLSRLNARSAARLSDEDADLAAELKDGGRIALLLDPVTREPARLPDGRLLTIDAPQKRSKTEGLESMVSWRSDVGVYLQVGGGAERFVSVLRESFPEVNVVRLDFNAESVDNASVTEEWRDFALTAANAGLGLVIQNSDGDLAGGLKRAQPVELGPPDALAQVSGEWKINRVQADWQKMRDWFRRPENARILDAVVGWELINEPMAYGNKPEAGALYSRHMADLIGALDWGDKRLFVGGLRASAQFEHLDHDLIRRAAGDRLVWSAHMYPGWVVAKTPDPDGGKFHDQICRRIGSLTQPGDDIMVTESQLYTEAGSLDPATGGGKAAQSYNMARKLPWFADNGIGWTWWPPVGRASQMLRWNGGKVGYEVEIESAAFAHWGWVRDETQAPKGAAEHWGGAGDETLAVDPSRGEKADHVVGGVSNPHGLVYALAGDDRVTGGELTDLLYGGAGGDRLEGGTGGDWLFGGPGDDLLEGGAGDDVLIDPEGANSLTGGAGNDHLEGSGTLDGGEGQDVLTATGEGTTLTGGPGSDRFLPPLRGRITFADFTPGEDRLDLSLLQTPDRAPTLELRGADGETTLVWGDLAVTMPGVTGLTEADIINAGPRRVVLTGG